MTTPLAIYGAIIGTAGFLLSLHLAMRDRPMLEVSAGPDDPARNDLRPATDRAPRMLVHVRNRGRRPVAIERIWYTRVGSPKSPQLLTDRFDQGTQVIAEGHSETYELRFDTVTPDDLNLIVVESQDGRVWKGRYDKRARPMRWNQA